DKFDKPLRDALKTRFDRFAILKRWNFPDPTECLFDVERVNAQGEDIPGQVEDTIFTALFDPTTFEKSILQIARDSGVVGDVLDMLYEPPPSPDSTAIPFVGDTRVYESIMGMAA